MYRSNTLQKMDYLQIYQCQFPTAEFNFNHFHSCSVTDHVLLLYILCIDLSFSIPNRIQSVPFLAFYWSCFTSLYIVHLCKKKSFVTEMGQTRPRKMTEERPHMTWLSKGGTTVQWKSSLQPWAAHSWRRWSNQRLWYQHLNR